MSSEIRNEANCEKVSSSHERAFHPIESMARKLAASDLVKDLEQRNEHLQKQVYNLEMRVIETARENEVLKKMVRQV